MNNTVEKNAVEKTLYELFNLWKEGHIDDSIHGKGVIRVCKLAKLYDAGHIDQGIFDDWLADLLRTMNCMVDLVQMGYAEFYDDGNETHLIFTEKGEQFRGIVSIPN